MSKLLSDHILFFIADSVFTLKELGPMADMPISQGFQALVDSGMLGQGFVGRPWHEIIKSSSINLEVPPEEDDVFLTPLFQKYQAERARCEELSRQGQLTQEDKDVLLKVRREYKAAKKLSQV
jgi:hypothetical protein